MRSKIGSQAQEQTGTGKAGRFSKKALVLAVSLALGQISEYALAGKNSPAVSTALSTLNTAGGRRIASNHGNRMLAIWSDTANGSIYGQYLLDGQPQGNVFRITSETAGSYLSVAMNSHGDAVVIWLDSNSEVHAQPVPASSVADIATPPIVIATAETDSVLNVAMDDAGNFGVVWGDVYTAYLEIFDYSGYSISGTVQVSASGDCYGAEVDETVYDDFRYATTSACAPDIAMNSVGDAVVTWAGTRVRAQRFDITGSPVGSTLNIDTTPADDTSFTGDNKTIDYNVMNPVVAMDEAGDFAVAWEGLQVINVQKWIAPNKKAGTPGYFTFDNKKSMVTRSLQLQQFNSSNQPLKRDKLLQQADEILAKASRNGRGIHPHIAMDSSGNTLVAWQRERIKKFKRCQTSYGYTYCSTTPLPYSDIRARRYSNSTGALAATTPVTTLETGSIKAKKGSKTNLLVSSSSDPSVAFDSSGNFGITFNHSDSDQYVSAYMNYEAGNQHQVAARLYAKTGQ